MRAALSCIFLWLVCIASIFTFSYLNDQQPKSWLVEPLVILSCITGFYALGISILTYLESK